MAAAPPVSSAASGAPQAPLALRPAREHWSVRLRDLLSTYLPLLAMLLLAAATWWLVRQSPAPEPSRAAAAAVGAPDYILSGVELVRYRGDGSLMARVRGRELRHYPDGDRVELDEAVITADHPRGEIRATARQAVMTEGGRRIRLEGDVVLTRQALPGSPAFELRARGMELDTQVARAWSSQPVQWVQEGSRVEAAGFEYRQDQSRLELQGPVRAWVYPSGVRRR